MFGTKTRRRIVSVVNYTKVRNGPDQSAAAPPHPGADPLAGRGGAPHGQHGADSGGVSGP